jgi:hypothetical protein
MQSFFSIAARHTPGSEDCVCLSTSHRMPRRYLRVLPSLTRPNLFSGD